MLYWLMFDQGKPGTFPSPTVGCRGSLALLGLELRKLGALVWVPRCYQGVEVGVLTGFTVFLFMFTQSIVLKPTPQITAYILLPRSQGSIGDKAALSKLFPFSPRPRSLRLCLHAVWSNYSGVYKILPVVHVHYMLVKCQGQVSVLSCPAPTCSRM